MLAMVLTFSIFGIVCRAKADSTYQNTYNSTYGTSVGCTFCHTSAPALNATGTKFKNSGFNYASIAPVPTVTAFSIPVTSTSLTVTITTFTATDNVPVTGYMVTESTTPPSASATGWSATPPASYTFATEGTKTLYAWIKDGANIVSSSLSASVTISTASQESSTGMSIWVGQWFKLTTKITGSCSGSSGLISDSGSSVGYLKLWEWDSNNQILQGDLYEYDTATAQWSSQPLSLQFIAGSDLDFLCQSQATDTAANTTEGFTARIVGKGTGGVLKSATFKSLGGYYIDALNQSGSIVNCAGGLKLTGALIQELKVPVPSNILLH
jgi:hypothetical protein